MATYIYNRAFSTSNMTRLSCTFRGDFVKGTWGNSGYTASGDSTALNRYSTVTVSTPQVTATGWNNSGSTTYNLYCVLYTKTGNSYTSATQNVKWSKSSTNVTLNFTLTGVLGEWDYFEIWAQQWTYTTASHYLYWFNNNGGTVTVSYVTEENGPTTGLMKNEAGQWVNGNYYIWTSSGWKLASPLIWKTENPITYTYPEAAMTSHISQGCLACSSDEWDQNYPAWRLFDKSTATLYVSNAGTNSERWVQLSYPRPLYNINVRIDNYSSNKGITSGIIYGSNDNGITLTQIGSFSGRDGASGVSTIHECNNTTTPYTTVRLQITSFLANSMNNVDVGEIYISGTDIGANGGWVGAGLAEYNKTLEYPEAAMTADSSQNCVVSASSIYNSSNYAWYAFNKSTSWGWPSAANATSPQWIQIILPEPLYNVNLIFLNSTSTGRAPASGIIYGSNDNGTTLTQIGSYSGRVNRKGFGSTVTCSGTKNTAYKTIRIGITTWFNDSGVELTSGTNIDFGEIYVTGTRRKS